MPSEQSAASLDFLKLFEDEKVMSRVSADLYAEYKSAKRTMSFDKGAHLFDAHDSPKNVYIISSGIVKLSQIGAYGKEQILRFITPGDMVGYRSLLCGESFRSQAEAMTAGEALVIPSDIFMKMLDSDRALSLGMLRKIAYELGESSDTVTFLAQKTVRERLAEMLLTLEGKLGTDAKGYIRIALTREEIANLIGTATESAIRLLSEFKQDQLIETQGRNIKILQPQKLGKIAHVSG